MRKKGVPEWMNSSLWSSSSPSSSPSSPRSPPIIINDPSSRSDTFSSPQITVQPQPDSIPQPVIDPLPFQPPTVVRISGDDDISDSAELNKEEISKQSQLLAELSKKVINLSEVRRLASQGIPDAAGIRSTVWKLLLGYLPNDRDLWIQEMTKKRSQYQAFKDDFLVNPSEITRILDESSGIKNEELDSKEKCVLQRSHISHEEHPLSLGQTSVWNQFFQDTETVEQIDRDVMRTHPDMHFFSGDSSLAKTNQEALKNILIIFAKLNPGIKYVQGMNEVLAPIYYVFRNDPDENNAAYAEADTFFCFVELLGGFRDNFCQKLDNSVVGIRSTIGRLSQLLKKHDGELWRHLETITKEFNFADSIHIWDTLLSDPEGPQETLLRICCAMLILVRKCLLAGDFTSNSKDWLCIW